ncbi:thioesterase family protein [Haliea sp. E1-2-M8]|uniref:acyl-CoA thioesterase n=1 Tax=Haliea sp. E1-2-M8 TaxID=3064706 RepID=UPI002725C261|nr:thioesterase family protein [Haliea sp. E1-2-M8]MDO8861282.1 thioesterase family protein [Haliea sp. E1-2-M8]
MAATILPYRNTMLVRFSDTDAQGHLYFANYLVYADEVAGFYMEELGLNAMNPQAAPCFIFTVNINCDYLGECRAYETVEVRLGYTRLGSSSADLAFELYADRGSRILARGSITQVFTDKESRRPTPIPAQFRAAIVARQPALADA